MKVKLSDIIGAIEMTDQDSDYFLDKETGEEFDKLARALKGCP